MTATDWLLLVVLSVLWAGSFLFAKIALADMPPLTLGLGRVAIAAAIVAILIKPLGGTVPRDLATWKRFTILATVNNAIPFTLILLGQIHITIGLASILNATSPLFTALIAHWMTHDDKLNRGRILGVAVGFAGVVILLGPDLLSELGTQLWAQLALLGAALSYAFGALYARRMRGLPPVTIAGGQLAMATVVLLPLALVFDGPWAFAKASAGSLAAMAALATFSTAIAYLMYFRLIARAGATNAILVTFLIPVSAPPSPSPGCSIARKRERRTRGLTALRHAPTLNHMVKYQNAALDRTFAALSDPTRRALLARLAEGDGLSVSELAQPFPVSLPAVMKHLDVLSDAGLVSRSKSGRVVSCHLTAAPMEDAMLWLIRYQRFWTKQLDRFAKFVEDDSWPPNPPPTPPSSRASRSNVVSMRGRKKSTRRGRTPRSS